MQQFVEHIKMVKLEPGEVMVSYDVKAHFTSVSIDPTIIIVHCKLQQDPLHSQRNLMSIPQIVTLLRFCLKMQTSSSRVSIMNRSMVQQWVPPLAPSSQTCLLKSSKLRLSVLPPHHHLWLMYVDDTFYTTGKTKSATSPAYQFTGPTYSVHHRGPQWTWCLTSLDTLISPGPDNTLTTTAYRKLTHTDKNLHWDSNLLISAKNSVFNTMVSRAREVCSNQLTLQQENGHIRKALLACNFPPRPLTYYKSNLTTGTTWRVYGHSTPVNTTTPTALVPATKVFPW